MVGSSSLALGSGRMDPWIRSAGDRVSLGSCPPGSAIQRLGRGSVALDARVGGRVAIDVAPDGGVIVAGLSDSRSPVTPVTRLRPDGSTDSEFGEAGLTTLTVLVAGAMLIQPDGRILVGGVRWPAVSGSGLPTGGVVVRLDVRGRPDVSFGEDGVAMLREDGPYGLVDFIHGLALQPDGAVVAVGTSDVATSYKGSYAFLGTVTRDGQGAHLADVGSEVFAIDKDCFEEGANALAVQPDAKVLVGGSVCEETSWIARYARDLRLDAGTPLRLHDTRPQSVRSLRASNTTTFAQLTARIRATVPAHVLVTVRRARFGKGSSAVVGTGGRVWSSRAPPPEKGPCDDARKQLPPRPTSPAGSRSDCCSHPDSSRAETSGW